MSTRTTRRTGCAEFAGVFQHPLVEEPPTSSASAEDRRTAAVLTRQAADACDACPLLTQCLYNAVVDYDVSGFCGGTTRKQRTEIRARLGVEVEPEDFDTLAGVQARHRQVDHEEVVRLRNANPHESLETIAHRLGCSLSTVKRHLRRSRTETKVASIADRPAPTVAQVVAVAREVLGRGTTARRAA